jgi:NAD(P)-dependent dehydrogenase (short-subunit alcohol dehydrogenase family)
VVVALGPGVRNLQAGGSSCGPRPSAPSLPLAGQPLPGQPLLAAAARHQRGGQPIAAWRWRRPQPAAAPGPPDPALLLHAAHAGWAGGGLQWRGGLLRVRCGAGQPVPAGAAGGPRGGGAGAVQRDSLRGVRGEGQAAGLPPWRVPGLRAAAAPLPLLGGEEGGREGAVQASAACLHSSPGASCAAGPARRPEGPQPPGSPHAREPHVWRSKRPGRAGRSRQRVAAGTRRVLASCEHTASCELSERAAAARHPALQATAKIRAGETVLVTAAAGGTGQFAVQLAKLAGCRVVAVCGSEAKAAAARRLGADEVVEYRREALGVGRRSSCRMAVVCVRVCVCVCGVGGVAASRQACWPTPDGVCAGAGLCWGLRARPRAWAGSIPVRLVDGARVLLLPPTLCPLRPQEAVARLCPAGVDVVYEGVGGAVQAALLPHLAPGGRLLQVRGQQGPAVCRLPAADEPRGTGAARPQRLAGVLPGAKFPQGPAGCARCACRRCRGSIRRCLEPRRLSGWPAICRWATSRSTPTQVAAQGRCLRCRRLSGSSGPARSRAQPTQTCSGAGRSCRARRGGG